MNKMSKAPTTSRNESNPHRNRIERKRQYEIDEEFQKLMCFLPKRHSEQKMSRNLILEELYKVALEKMSDVHVKPVIVEMKKATN